ncbi:MAG TPA: hypothetical protein VMI75_09480 [Polyangiaceae bacterium]|nr:hypothetical protein [Polyangiaceae bacterium]
MQTLIDPFEIASKVPKAARSGEGPRTDDLAGDVASSLVAIDEKLEEDAIVDELGPELAGRPGARVRVWCSED